MLDDLYAGGGAIDDLLAAFEGDQRENDRLIQRVKEIAVIGDAEEDRLGIDIDRGAAADGPAGFIENGRIKASLEQADILKNVRNVVMFDGITLVIGLSLPGRFLSKCEL